MDEERYITLQEAQEALQLSQRQVQYYVSDRKIHSKKVGRRLMLLAADVEKMAKESGTDQRKPPKPEPVEMVQDTGPLVDYLREKEQQLMMMARRIGELESQLEQRLLPEDTMQLRVDLEVAKQHIADLERQIEQAQANPLEPQQPRQPWWKRLLS